MSQINITVKLYYRTSSNAAEIKISLPQTLFNFELEESERQFYNFNLFTASSFEISLSFSSSRSLYEIITVYTGCKGRWSVLVFIIDELSPFINYSKIQTKRESHPCITRRIRFSVYYVGQDTHALSPPTEHLLGVSYFRRGIPYA